MSGLIYYAIGLVIAVIGGGIAWLFRRYRATAEEKASLEVKLAALEEKHESLGEIADAQANPITDINRAFDIVRKRRKTRN